MITFVHTLISILGLVSGFVLVYGFLTNKPLDAMTAVFLVTTVLTSATGFLFPFFGLLPSHILAILSLIILPIAIYARYARHLAGKWRWIYVSGSMVALYFNAFVGVVQSFRRIPALFPLAPTQTEPPFQAAQGVLLLVFIGLTWAALRRFHPASSVTIQHAGTSAGVGR